MEHEYDAMANMLDSITEKVLATGKFEKKEFDITVDCLAEVFTEAFDTWMSTDIMEHPTPRAAELTSRAIVQAAKRMLITRDELMGNMGKE